MAITISSSTEPLPAGSCRLRLRFCLRAMDRRPENTIVMV